MLGHVPFWTPDMEKPILYHGTSSRALDEILGGTNRVMPVYDEANVSLGGAYFTIRRTIAEVAAAVAVKKHGGEPVVLTIEPVFDLLPDEDWVVRAAERPLKEDFDWRTETYRTQRYQDFFADLFSGYDGDGYSLSDAYADRYETLNADYDITWQDSLRYIGSVRQAELLTAHQIVQAEYLNTATVVNRENLSVPQPSAP